MRLRLAQPAAAALLIFAAPFTAAAAPSFDCAKADGAAEELVCADADLAALDVALAARFSAAMAAARSGADADAAAARLRAEQRGWIKGRDACWKAADLRDCVEDAYTRRDAILAASWMLGDVGPPVFYQCGGNPADEIAVFFLDAPRRALRLERGDRIEAMAQTRSASGARYDGDFGAMFWEKGGEARLMLPPEPETVCRRR
ncbi:MliC family protein [Rubrimonas cliftonensis]|uniref:Membrane-bound lysozyme-inhibitor of c-type lysozyme n=1 Tax=Rubrimonas cliftonensis TaxID=89524 RepID=A0A1H3VXL7_9RHOB|nr:MliC family protein [Rubrimonas cliftonensis]SDZ79549.1 Protein of unknown function [Rubrimonas cliftonensis]